MIFIFLFISFIFSTFIPHGHLHKICFHNNAGSERGTAIAVFDYADFNERLLGHKSFIIFAEKLKNSNRTSIPRFQKRFNVTFYNSLERDSGIGGPSLPSHALSLGCDVLYMTKPGGMKSAPLYPDSFHCQLPTAVHGIFHFEKHGTTYAGS